MIPVSTRLIDDLTEKLVRDLEELEELILFGSWARGDAGPQDDLDLLLVVDADFSPGGESRWEYVKKVRAAKSPFPLAVDFRVFSTAEVATFRARPNHLVAVALGEGTPLYRRVAAVA